jgi:hypothetical protein
MGSFEFADRRPQDFAYHSQHHDRPVRALVNIALAAERPIRVAESHEALVTI